MNRSTENSDPEITDDTTIERYPIAAWYVLMILAMGLTIGAITGLSRTSVSETLTELIVVFITGLAGVYFLRKKSSLLEDDESDTHQLLKQVGKTGLVFLIAFWLGFLPTSWYRLLDRSVITFSDKLDPVENMAIAEYAMHAANFGVSLNSIKKQVDRLEERATAENSCTFTASNAEIESKMISHVLDTAAPCYGASTAGAMTFLKNRFDNAHSKFVGKDRNPADGINLFDQSLFLYLELSNYNPNLLTIDTRECIVKKKKISASDAVLANTFYERLRDCKQSTLHHELSEFREMARNYSGIWGGKPVTLTQQPTVALENGTDRSTQ